MFKKRNFFSHGAVFASILVSAFLLAAGVSQTTFAQSGDCSGEVSGTLNSTNPNVGSTYFNESAAKGGSPMDFSILGLAQTGYAPSTSHAACVSDGTSTTDTIYELKGWSWNDNLGFISFACDLGFNETVPCGPFDYGVTVDFSTRELSGYAWNPSFGWINFSKYAAYPTSGVRVNASNTLEGFAYTAAGVWINFSGVGIELPDQEEYCLENPEECEELDEEIIEDEWCDGKPDLCMEIEPNPLVLGGVGSLTVGGARDIKVANGKEGYYIHAYLRGDDGRTPLDLSEFNMDEFEITWNDSVKLEQIAGETYSEANSAVPYKPLTWDDFVEVSPGHFRSAEKIVSYGPTTNANLSATVATPTPIYVENESIAEDMSFANMQENVLAIESVQYQISRISDGATAAEGVVYPNGLPGLKLKFRPLIELNTLYSLAPGTNEKQDIINAYINVPVSFKVGARQVSSTPISDIVEDTVDNVLRDLSEVEKLDISMSGNKMKDTEVIVDSQGVPHVFSSGGLNDECAATESLVHAYKEEGIWTYECIFGGTGKSTYGRQGLSAVSKIEGANEVIYVAFGRSPNASTGKHDWALTKKVKAPGANWNDGTWQYVGGKLESSIGTSGSVTALDLTVDSSGKLAIAILERYSTTNVKAYFYYDSNGDNNLSDGTRYLIDQDLGNYIHSYDNKIELKSPAQLSGQFAVVYGSGPGNAAGQLGSKIFYKEFDGEEWGSAKEICAEETGAGCFSPSFAFNGSKVIFSYATFPRLVNVVSIYTTELTGTTLSAPQKVAAYNKDNLWDDTDIEVSGGTVHLVYGTNTGGKYVTSATGTPPWSTPVGIFRINRYIEMQVIGAKVYIAGNSANTSGAVPYFTTNVSDEPADPDEATGNSDPSNVRIDLKLDYNESEVDQRCQEIFGEDVSTEFNFHFTGNSCTEGDCNTLAYNFADLERTAEEEPLDLMAVADIAGEEEQLCDFVKAPVLYSEVSYVLDGKNVTYYSNKLPRVAGSFLSNLGLFVTGQLQLQDAIFANREEMDIDAFSPQDTLVNITHDIVTKNISGNLAGVTSLSGVGNSGCTITNFTSTGISNNCRSKYKKFTIGSGNTLEDVYYFKNSDVNMELTSSSWTGNKVVIVDGGHLFINKDIYDSETTTDKMVLIVLRDYSHDYGQSGNAYVDPDVKNIQANIVLDGSLFSYDGDKEHVDLGVGASGEPIWDSFADMISVLKNQLRIVGSLSSRNSVGGGTKVDDKNYLVKGTGEVIMVPENPDDDQRMAALIYDLNSLRFMMVNVEMREGLPVDQACDEALDSQEILLIDRRALEPVPEYLEGCDGIQLDLYDAGTGGVGFVADMVPPDADSGIYAQGLEAAVDIYPVYIEYSPSDSFIFKKESESSVR